MGDPRKFRKKYETPKKVWDKERLKIENALLKKYGLKNMRELWRNSLIIKKVRREVRKLFSLEDEIANARGKRIIDRLYNLGIVEKDIKIEDLLSLTVEDVLRRRLQTLVYDQGLAKNIRQARQLIVHGFIAVNGKKVNRPSYLVKRNDSISYYAKPKVANASN
ncbi:MAG: 30S ribosomal protein S4 [Candidatus Micrarchaeia archaeon]